MNEQWPGEPAAPGEPVRILVTISRTWSAMRVLRTVLTAWHAVYPTAVLIHGDHPRGDRAAAAIWQELGSPTEAFPVTDEEWARAPRAAGPLRNRAMVAQRPVLCLAFIREHSAGAEGCAGMAESAGVRTLRFRQEELDGELGPAPWEDRP